MKYCLLTISSAALQGWLGFDTEADVLTVSSASSAALSLLKNGDTKL